MDKVVEMFGHISEYDEEKQKHLWEVIECFLWDGNLTPEEFLEVFANADEFLRKKWFAKILSVTDWYDVIDIFGIETAIKYALDDETISMLFPEANQQIWKTLQRVYKEN